MKLTIEQKQRLRYIAGDLLATSLAWFIFNFIRFITLPAPAAEEGLTFMRYYSYEPVILGQLLFPLIMMGLYYLSGYYNAPLFRSRVNELVVTFCTAAIGTVLIFFMAVVDDPIPDKASNLELLGMLFLMLFGIVYIVRLSITWYGRTRIKRGEIQRYFAIVGLTGDGRRLRRRMEKAPGRGNKVVAYIDPGSGSPDHFDSLPVVNLSDLQQLTSQTTLAAFIVPEEVTAGKGQDFSEVLNSLYPTDIPILISPSSLRMASHVTRLGDIIGEPLIDICSANISEATRNLKRAGDVVVSLMALTLLSPLMLAMAILVKADDSHAPVFYRQERIGLHKKRFRIIKFRTMKPDAEASGPCLSTGEDDRITRPGRFMRKYRLDELPQFVNVLLGQMSLVGPRPEREFYIRQILKKAPYYSLLHQVRPGLTSWGMVKYGYASSVDQMIERSRFDLIYLENISLAVDLKIMLHTVSTVLHGKGI